MESVNGLEQWPLRAANVNNFAVICYRGEINRKPKHSLVQIIPSQKRGAMRFEGNVDKIDGNVPLASIANTARRVKEINDHPWSSASPLQRTNEP